jgi:hypothetical protein
VFAIKNKEKKRYRPNEVLIFLKEKTWVDKNMHWHTLMWKKYNARPSKLNNWNKCDNNFCEWYDLTGCYLYFDNWIDFLIEQELGDT